MSTPTELVVLGLDISESTSIIEDLFRFSPDGSERTATALNAVFTLLAEVITEHGGSVIALAGDEMVAVWQAGDSDDMAASARRAARAAVLIQERAARLTPVGGYPIRLRAGIGAGRAWLLDVGREQGRRVFAAVGPALQEMARAQKAVSASEIGLGADVAMLLGSRAIDGATGHPGVPRLATAEPVPALPAPDRAASVTRELAARYVPELIDLAVRSSPVVPRAELAPVTAVFVTFRPGYWDDDAVRTVGEATGQALDILDSYAGTLIGACQDGDGLTLVAGFGLPPVIREREAVRATLAALEISRAMQEFVEHGIGVATGHVFCGICGSSAYRQYAMVGPTVNLAARLMQHAQNEVLCDQVSRHLTRDRLRFSARGQVAAKGFANPVEVYRPEWHEVDPGLPTLRRLAADPGGPITRGRERERAELAGRLVALDVGTSTAVVVAGEPGVGKSHLAMDLLWTSERYERLTVLVGTGDDVDPRPYHAWKRVISRALGLTSVREVSRREYLVRERLSKWPELEAWAPLLNDLLELTLDDTTMRDMTGPARRENTIRVLVQLLTDAAAGAPLLVVIDDSHWMDSASWELVRAVARDVHPLMIVLLTRPDPEPPAGREPRGADDGSGRARREVTAYLAEHGALLLGLEPLAPDVTEQIACDALGVDLLDGPVRTLFREMVDGSPLFTAELAFQLRADGIITVVETAEKSLARLTIPAADLNRLRLPVRVDEVFRARLSELSERQRAIIRAASVIGNSFDEERIRAADQLLGPGSLADELAELARRKVFDIGPEGWRFAHALIKDAAVQSVPPSELRLRHRALAEWYEAQEAGPESYPIIARHWSAAGQPQREIEYLEAAATNSLARGVGEEAVTLIERAIVRDRSLAPDRPAVSDERRAFWHAQLGEGLGGQNRLDEAIAAFTTALGLVGQRVPRRRIGWLARLVRQVLVQALHLLPVVSRRLLDRRSPTVLSQVSWISSRLGEAFYFQGDLLAWTATNVAAINQAERAGDPGLAGRAYSGLANLVGTLRLHRLAARYFHRSRWKVTGVPFGTESQLTLDVMPDLAWEHNLTATISEAVYLRTLNRSATVSEMLNEVITQLRTTGQNFALEVALAVRGVFHDADGMLRSAQADFEELLVSARRRGNANHMLWGMTLLIPVLLHLDRRDEALALDDQLVRLFDRRDKLYGPNIVGSHLHALLARGRDAEVLTLTRQALRVLGAMPLFFHLIGMTATVQVCLDVMVRAHGTPGERLAKRMGRRALKALRAFARMYPFGRARYELYRGLYLGVRGRNRAAHRHLTSGLAAAERTGMPLDGARIRLLLAERLPKGSPARLEQLRLARETLDELGLRRLKAFEHVDDL